MAKGEESVEVKTLRKTISRLATRMGRKVAVAELDAAVKLGAAIGLLNQAQAVIVPDTKEARKLLDVARRVAGIKKERKET